MSTGIREDGSEVRVLGRVDGGWIELQVVDRGAGIPARDLERIFERFYRVDRARSRDTGGTGLGLSIARKLAQLHGGTLELRNLAAGGLEAVLALPRSAPQARS